MIPFVVAIRYDGIRQFLSYSLAELLCTEKQPTGFFPDVDALSGR